MTATDAMISRLQAEIEEKRSFQDQLIESAQKEGRDLKSEEQELYTRAMDRMKLLEGQLEPLREGARIVAQSQARTAELQEAFAVARNPKLVSDRVEYRTAGAYLTDYVRSSLGNTDATERLALYHRAAAHQTTPDNPGLIPERLLSPILGQLDFARPLVGALGPRQLPSGAWSRPRVTQHTQVAKQTAEKAELASRKMLIGKVPIEADTFGGYVNVSRQNVDWSQPQVIDIVIGDLSNEYAFETEEEAGTVITAAAQTGPTLPATPTAQDFADALWAAAGLVFGNMWTARQPVGRLILAVAPDMLGLIGPLFAPVNPQNSQSSGFNAANFGEGVQGAVSGISAVVSGALTAGTALVISSNAVEVYEDRIGALQVIEPSVLGTQVAYAGYFAVPVLEATGVVDITAS